MLAPFAPLRPGGQRLGQSSPTTGSSRSEHQHPKPPPQQAEEPRGELDDSLDRTRVVELSWTGALVGHAVGVTTVPLAATLVASPPVGSGAPAPARVRATHSSWQPAAVTAAACGLTGLRVGLHWDLPAMLVFTLGLGVLAMSDVIPRSTIGGAGQLA